jgi:8-amino-3,8-dideoxy-alpha-D-manno-octulosonate transaminase
VDAFETDFAAFVGVKRALAVGSGTGALSVALSTLGVVPGQQIIVPAYLWVSVAAAAVNQGAILVLADIDKTFTLDPASLEVRITAWTTGVILVHMSGAAGDASAIRDIADRHGLFLLEDRAQCCGGSICGQKVRTFGHIGNFSFQMNKNMTSVEGGCLVTNGENLYRAFA